MSRRNTVLGYYQNLSTAKSAIQKLKREGFCRLASIYYEPGKGRRIKKHRNTPSYLLISLSCLFSLIFGLLLFVFSHHFDTKEILYGLLAVAALVAGISWLLNRTIFQVGSKTINRLKKTVFTDEVLVLAEVLPSNVKEAIYILRHVPGGHPITFILDSDIQDKTPQKIVLPQEAEIGDQFHQAALDLAVTTQEIVKAPSSSPILLNEIGQIAKKIQELHGEIVRAEYTEQPSPMATEWLLDNMPLVQGSIEEIKGNLSKSFYKELPKVMVGSKPLPRIYTIASQLVHSSVGKITKQNILDFIETFQTVTPLTIGELWALPLMLKLRLLEWVQCLATRLVRRIHTGELANFWGNRLLLASARAPAKLPELMQGLESETPQPTPHFSEELIDHLFDEATALNITKQWLETKFNEPLTEVFHKEQVEETLEQFFFSSAMMSLVTLSQLSWQDIFEKLSTVDAILKTDPAGIYSQMDFYTRNLYRKEIEQLRKHSNVSEQDIAQKSVEIADKGHDEIERHIGYYLIDKGRSHFESLLGYIPPFKQRLQRYVKSHPSFVYLGSIGLATLGLTAGLIAYGHYLAENPVILAVLAILALIPLSEIVIQIVNFLLVRFLPSSDLPKMDYQQEIPIESKSLVIVPIMLTSEAGITEEVDNLEVRYLANSEPGILFGLFSDFKDAPNQHMEKDKELIDLAIKKIQALDNKYGPGKFFLFHRQRVWSKSEGAWIGWERKRGKLESLNRYLIGEPMPENILYSGSAETLKNVRYIITLDSDTQLAKGQGKKLIEIFSHPLNRPVLTDDGKSLKRGYTIIQPVVCTDFWHTKNSLFLEIFSDPSLIDPYTHVVSNLSQDLTGEASYHGKGIYDLKAFHSILSDRYPTEHILSHDLIEGAYVGVGATATVCLFDSFPETYLGLIDRQRRWMRGDWQIIDWLFPRTPINNGKKEKNPLSLFNKWKIFDNLRRSLLPISLVLMFSFGWLFSNYASLWTAIGFITLFINSGLQLFNHLLRSSSYKSKSSWHEQTLGFLRTLITTALLPQEAYFSLDSICRVFYRRLISHRQLLEWTTSSLVNKSSHLIQRQFLKKLSVGSIFAVALFCIIYFVNSPALTLALPFCLLWVVGPFLVHTISRPRDRNTIKEITPKDRLFLRQVARRTWRYFDDFVTAETNWLPPDNYQAIMNVGIAPRTSPTNIGYWLIAILNAYDFRWTTCDRAIEKMTASFDSLNKLERFEGHFLNWYDILTLKPLYPRYISTVDSGNLLAALWTVQQGLEEILSQPILDRSILTGVEDTYRMAMNSTKNLVNGPDLGELEDLLSACPSDSISLVSAITSAYQAVQNTHVAYEQTTKISTEPSYWLKTLFRELSEWNELISRYFKWVSILQSLSKNSYNLININASSWKDSILATPFSLKMLAEGSLKAAFEQLLTASRRQDLPPEIKAWNSELEEAVTTAQWLAGEKLAQYYQVINVIDGLSDSMNLSYLYSKDRKLFAIGYNIDNNRLDNSYYDLLASEARLASLVAIAKDEVPVDHWWALSRPYGIFQGRRVLLSWGGTMFEYIMPALFNKQAPNSLLGEACESAVECQILYGKMRGIPWGVSEAAYSSIDAHKIYQYRSFGVPGLGLKRGLEKDLVVSPYSTLISLMIDPQRAIANLHRLANRRNNLWGSHGYFESIDYTRQADQQGDRGVVVETFMAHHQGMGLTALNNVLNDHAIIRRFHKDPRIAGVEYLLFERLTSTAPIAVKGTRRERNTNKLQPFSTVPIMGVTETPNTSIPKANLLSNHTYSVVVSNSGSGYSKWNDIEITRWRSDTTCDNWGSFFYIKDCDSKNIWSAAFQPVLNDGSEYSSSFKTDKVEFRRVDEDIETITDIVVSPEDNVEIRSMTFVNRSDSRKELEVTSYQELVLAPHAADRAHPAFNKLFIETEAVPELNGLIAFRRLRSPEDQPIWAAHLIALESPLDMPVQFETNRANFIGRGRSLKNPVALERDLSNNVGTVLDPIFSLRHRFAIEPGRQIKISFITLIGDNRPQVIALMEKYQDLKASQRAIQMAWTYSQLELRHLNITLEDVQLFQKLASRILYPNIQLRAATERLASNKLGQSRLWGYGVSGDIPLVVVSVDDAYDTTLIKQLLLAHTFWRLRGLKVDLLILNEEAIAYETPLHSQLMHLIHAYAFRDESNTAGGVHLKNINQIPDEDLTLILAVASIFLIAARGSLRQQLVSPMPAIHYPPKLVAKGKIEEAPSAPLPFLELPYFNGLGGYTPDGKSYDIYLGPGTMTPAPWINVIANPLFGTIVSETGSGTTWYGNSQSNRITPWSNDPIINPVTDSIYIRDEVSGVFWSATPSPVRELDAYRVAHKQGQSIFEHNSHGIEQELLISVPVDNNGGLPLRIQRLKLKNTSPSLKQLTVTSYHELILGKNKEETQMHVVTEWNNERKALFAYNRYNSNFGSHMAIFHSVPATESYTGDRTEFIGRNGTLSSPASMKRTTLSDHVGAGFDPCAALQINIELPPGATKEVFFVLGYAKDHDVANQLIDNSNTDEKLDQLIHSTTQWWDSFLESVQVDVPDLMVNFALNRWLPYQNLSCRIWGRSGFYQSSGAYGFRDQLQDGMALVYSLPHLAREHILTSAARQFEEGDVQHWWDPITGSGVRTRFSDDLLWLPFTTAHYVRTTGDLSILDEEVPFIKAPLLEPDEHEIYSTPEISTETASLLEHCRRALHKGMTQGEHGLPLIGGGDWNDGMNRVGVKGKGESVWLAWFLIHVLHDFLELLEDTGNDDQRKHYMHEAERLAKAIEAEAWDGAWYRRAYYDNGSPLGSKDCSEATIDSLAQSWAVISGAGNLQRSNTALKSAFEKLVNVQERIVLLLTPPFDKTEQDPGYIKGYPPGVRENGGQYTHGSLWLAMAYARKGDGNTAVELLKMMHPHWHTRTMEEIDKYKIEPYVLPGDVYDHKEQIGRGGWSWYTGSSAWMYRIWLEEILGFKLRNDSFRIECAIPKEWNGFKLRYRYKSASYEISVENPHHISRGTSDIELDGMKLKGIDIPLVDDGQTHTVRIQLKS